MAPLDPIDDLRTRPRYSVAAAARYIPGLSTSTLRSWVLGRTYPAEGVTRFFEPLIPLAEGRLSFVNLVEAHVLLALRKQHQLKIRAVRVALDYAQRELRLDHLLARRELLVAPGNLFLDRFGELINLSKAGQLALRSVLEAHLQRVSFDDQGRPIRLFPFLPLGDDRREIAIDPRLAFGRPLLIERGVTVEALVDRVNAGESVHAIAEDYGLEETTVERAITYAAA
jgi:uncharacterized protein (DUF433 family)